MVIRLGKLETTALIARSASIHIRDVPCRLALCESGKLETVPLQGHTDEYAVRPQDIAYESTMPDFKEWIDVYQNDDDMIKFQEKVVEKTDNQEIELKARKGIYADEDDYEIVTVRLEE